MQQGDKQSLSNRKRIESLKHKKDRLKTEQQLIRTALSSLDSKRTSHKIIFGDSDDDDVSETVRTNSGVVRTPTHTQTNSDRKTEIVNKNILFSSSDSEDNADDDSSQASDRNLFRIRPQFQGRKGQKLLKLQSNFNKDERFQLDERFMESDENSSEDEMCKNGAENEVSEKQRNLNVLQDVLGVQLPLKSPHTRKVTFRDPSTLRFDPTSEGAAKFEIKKEEKVPKEESVKEVEPAPLVSGDRFYEVSSSLKSAFTKTNNDKGGFSLLKTFRQDEDFPNEDTTRVAETYKVKTNLPQKIKNDLWNENKYFDSSDEETERGTERLQDRTATQEQLSEGKTKKKFFFLSEKDQCLKDGVEFFHRHKSVEVIQKQWEEVQPQLLELLYSRRRKAVQMKKGRSTKRNRKK